MILVEKIMTSRTEDVTKSRRLARDAGRRRLSSMLSANGSALYDELKLRYRSERELIEAALSALQCRNVLSLDELIAEISRRIK